MPRILITGAHSFVGGNYINFSWNKDIDEISLFDIKPENIDFASYDIVIHLVAIVHQSQRIKEGEYFRINRDICVQVAENAKKAGVKQFVFLSSVKVYGKFISNSGPWHEDSPCFPEDAYGKSKYEAEHALRRLEGPDFVVSVIRTPLVYGPGVKANMLNILKLVDRFPILPLAKVNNKRSFTSAENLVAFIDRIIERKASGIFIAMDEKPLSTTDLTNYISKYLDKKILLFRMPKTFVRIGKLIMPKIFERLYGSFEMDNSTTLKALDFKPPFTTEQCMKEMVLAYKSTKSV